MSVATTATVTVRFFASLREVVDRDTVELVVDEPCISSVRAKLASLFTPAQLEAISGRGVQVCVNQNIVRGDAALESGDEVAFLPPVTGG